MLNLQRFNACGSRPNHSMSPTSPDDVLIPVFCFVLLLHHFCQVCQICHENKHEWMVHKGLKWLIYAIKEWCVKSKDSINAYNIYCMLYVNTFTSTLKSPKGWWIDTLYRNHLAPFWRSRLGIYNSYMVVRPHPTNRKIHARHIWRPSTLRFSWSWRITVRLRSWLQKPHPVGLVYNTLGPNSEFSTWK